MAVKLEQRINDLENEVKAMKAICPIAGKLAKMVVQTSEGFTVGGSSNMHSIDIKFSPSYNRGKYSMTTLFPNVTSTYAGYTWQTIPTFAVLPQDGTGDVAVRIYGVVNSDVVRVTASGTSPGTFSRV